MTSFAVAFHSWIKAAVKSLALLIWCFVSCFSSNKADIDPAPDGEQNPSRGHASSAFGTLLRQVGGDDWLYLRLGQHAVSLV